MDINTLNKLYRLDFPDKEIVTGEGCAAAKIMMIGEAPGREEVEQARPFVGKAGKNLSEFLEVLQLRREDIFISNVVKFRPTKLSDRGSISNRTPTDEEVKKFLPYLIKEIEIINPQLIVTLGNTPLNALLGKGVTVGGVHGRIQAFGERKLYPLFHPASIIYNPSLKPVYQKDVAELKNLI